MSRGKREQSTSRGIRHWSQGATEKSEDPATALRPLTRNVKHCPKFKVTGKVSTTERLNSPGTALIVFIIDALTEI